jgi:ribose 5-phosphate isomerase B
LQNLSTFAKKSFMKRKIIIGGDHAGISYKKILSDSLIAEGFTIEDVGPLEEGKSVDYPDFAHLVAKKVDENPRDYFGILICGSGNGVAMTANKYPQVRAALCWNEEIAALARQHNDANVLCMPARFISEDICQKIVKTFLQTGFEGGRHAGRVNKICVI